MKRAASAAADDPAQPISAVRKIAASFRLRLVCLLIWNCGNLIYVNDSIVWYATYTSSFRSSSGTRLIIIIRLVMYLFSFLINRVRKSFSAVTYSCSWRYLNTYDRKLLRAFCACYTKHFEIPLLRLLWLYSSNLKVIWKRTYMLEDTAKIQLESGLHGELPGYFSDSRRLLRY